MSVAELTIKTIKEKLEKKEISCEELVNSYLQNIEDNNEALNALLGVSDTAVEEAKQIDKKRAKGEELGALAGVPVVVKDNILVQGWNATSGSKILENYKATYNATVVERLKNAGAILLGRSNMDEFAMGSSTENSHFGPTKNPWNTDCVPGGTSGGSATAVAAGFAPVALGSDTGGSVRQPASLCGIVGLKPTYGRVSRYGLMAAASSLDQIGPITRTVEDAALLMESIEGDDPKDATSSALGETFIPELAQKDIKGLKIGVPKEFFVEGMDDGVKTQVNDAIKQLESEGAKIVEISLPHTEYALATFYIIMPCETSSNLGRYDGIRYGYSSQGESLIQSYERTRGEGFGPEVQRRIMIGTYALSAGYYDQYYKKALKVRHLIKQDFDKAFESVDVIAGPTSPSVAWKIGEKFNDPLTMYLSDIYTVSANLATIPAISVPCGFSNGLPVGLQFMANRFDEQALYRTGMFYQSITDWHLRTP
ncbi:MAG: Asp-tRNA(Asn)/Glu-tRNA(Gln) amidotransferase subunit GatA [Patescibacteria group bacterium]